MTRKARKTPTMLDEDGLNVWFKQQLVGYLWRNAIDYIGFRYDEDWILNGGFPISRTLPLQNEAFAEEDAIAHRFFANLLPEGGAREHIVRDLKVGDSDFNLLKAIGGECAGALSILPAEKVPSKEHGYRPLTSDDMSRLVVRRGHLFANDPINERPRLSLAGAQSKCAVLMSEKGYFNPIGDAPSTHILKFESTEYKHLPSYEVFTSLLAKEIGLPVVDIALETLDGKRYAKVARYDRISDADDIERIHQEDFCQALGYAHGKKYQHDGGPTFAQCLNLIRDTSDDPAIDSQNLLRWQVFNVLAGNSDGHAKNLSLLYHRDGTIGLTPFYDLVCTRAIERIDANLAFDIGGERNPAVITMENWTQFAKDCDVSLRFMQNIVKDVAKELLRALPVVRKAFEASYGKLSALDRVERVVNKQCQRFE